MPTVADAKVSPVCTIDMNEFTCFSFGKNATVPSQADTFLRKVYAPAILWLLVF
jgi:hypothetical protein